ncbi:MAG: hypothetical protein ACI845_003126 [Gammaproteobacteria bacterium]|jgi:hypothetical protein
MNTQSVSDFQIRLKKALFVSLLAVSLAACAPDPDSGDDISNLVLPTDTALKLQCEDVGIFQESCVLGDPDNPYATIDITDSNKFDLADDTPSAKARYYLWASALARRSSGENQYYVARSLQELFALSGSKLAREQAKRAYRSVLDNYFGTITYWEADWLNDDVFYAVSLNDLTGGALYQPTDADLIALYDAPFRALEDLSSWGYVYDIVTEELVRVQF